LVVTAGVEEGTRIWWVQERDDAPRIQ
jgi:hypothetical protein